MTTRNTRLDLVKIRLGAGGLATILVGAIFFMLTENWENQTDRLAWTWMFIAVGAATSLIGVVIGCRSTLVKILLWTGVAAFTASIFAVRIGLTIAP